MKKLTILLALFSTIAISSTSVLASASTDKDFFRKTDNVANVSYLSKSSTNGYVNGDAVAFRRGPSLNSDIIYLLDKGTPINITGTTIGDNMMWATVTYKGISGYIYFAYVSYN